MTVQRKQKIVRATKPEQSDPIDLPTFDNRYAVIRERSQEINILEQWEYIRAWLKLEPDNIHDLRSAIRKHADMAERAKQLSQSANSEYEIFELKCQDRKQIWRIAAMSYWETQKEAKTITKQITEKMIEDWMIEQHGDLYVELETRRIQLNEVREQLKALAAQVNNKGHDLRKLLESEIRRPSTTPNWMDDDKGR